jgi:hypothetical protein
MPFFDLNDATCVPAKAASHRCRQLAAALQLIVVHAATERQHHGTHRSGLVRAPQASLYKATTPQHKGVTAPSKPQSRTRQSVQPHTDAEYMKRHAAGYGQR